MPAGTGDGEEVEVVVDVAKDVQSGVMLEKQVHLNTNTPNILEHVGELHVLRIRSVPVKATLLLV